VKPETSKPDTSRQPEPTIQPIPANVAATAAVWSDLLGFWTGQRLVEQMQPVPVLAEAVRATEHVLQACQIALETNRTVAEAMRDVARRQQDLTLTAAQSTFAGFPGADARQATTEALRRAANVCADMYGHGLDAAWKLADTALELQRRASTQVAGQVRSAT